MGTFFMIYIQPFIPVVREIIQINTGNDLHTTVFQIPENLVGILLRHITVHLETAHSRKHVLGIFSKKQTIIQLGPQGITLRHGLCRVQNSSVRQQTMPVGRLWGSLFILRVFIPGYVMGFLAPPVLLQSVAPGITSCQRQIQTFHNGSITPVDRGTHRITVILVGTVFYFIQNIITEHGNRLICTSITDLVIKIITSILIKCRQSPGGIIGITHDIDSVLQMVFLHDICIQ